MTTSSSRPGEPLRARIADHPVLMPGVWDALSARLAAAAGFDTVFLSGFAVAGAVLGVPDIGLLTQTEMAEAARRVCAAVPDTAVVVDGDTGYGDEANVARTIDLWESAGAAGIFIEDQVWPKRCGHMSGKQVVPTDEWLAKLETALERRSTLFVTARTDARAPHGLDEAIGRARTAAALGVDAVFVEAPESIDELTTVASALPDAILVANMVERGRTPLLTIDELAELGFRLVVSPLSGLLRATHALQEAFGALRRDGSLANHLDDLVGFDDFTDLVDLPGWQGLADPSGR